MLKYQSIWSYFNLLCRPPPLHLVLTPLFLACIPPIGMPSACFITKHFNSDCRFSFLSLPLASSILGLGWTGWGMFLGSSHAKSAYRLQQVPMNGHKSCVHDLIMYIMFTSQDLIKSMITLFWVVRGWEDSTTSPAHPVMGALTAHVWMTTI